MNQLLSLHYRQILGFFVTTVAASLLTAETHAAVLISQSSEVPTNNVFLSIASNGTGNSALNGLATGTVSSVRELGQTFLVPGSTPIELHAFSLQLSTAVQAGSARAGFTVSIYNVANSTAMPTDAPLYTTSGNLPDIMTVGQYLTFTFDQPVTLNAGSYYAIQIGFTELAPNQSFNVATGNDYANGRAFYYANSPNASVMNYIGQSTDLKMVLQTIPEPGSVLMLGVGVGLFLLRRRI